MTNPCANQQCQEQMLSEYPVKRKNYPSNTRIASQTQGKHSKSNNKKMPKTQKTPLTLNYSFFVENTADYGLIV